MQLELTQTELSEFLKAQLQINTQLIEKGLSPITFNISGEKGIGKTQIVKLICNELGMNFVKLNLNGLEELGSLIGFPVEEHLIHTPDGDKWVPKNILEISLKDPANKYGFKSKMSVAPPDYIANMTEGPGVLFLDDYTRALSFFMQATMQITEEGGYHSWRLPKGWMVILSTNPEGGEYNVASLDSAQRTRFITLNMKFDPNSWLNWAEAAGIDFRCLAFVENHKELFARTSSVDSGIQTDDTLCARTMTMFFNSISGYEDWSSNMDKLKILGTGSIGVSATNQFISFINDKFDKLPSPEEVVKKMTIEQVAAKFQEVIGKADASNWRKPVASMMMNRIITYGLHTASDITNKEVTRIMDIILMPFFSVDLQHYAARRAAVSTESQQAGRRQVFQALLLDPRIQKLISNSVK